MFPGRTKSAISTQTISRQIINCFTRRNSLQKSLHISQTLDLPLLRPSSSVEVDARPDIERFAAGEPSSWPTTLDLICRCCRSRSLFYPLPFHVHEHDQHHYPASKHFPATPLISCVRLLNTLKSGQAPASFSASRQLRRYAIQPVISPNRRRIIFTSSLRHSPVHLSASDSKIFHVLTTLPLPSLIRSTSTPKSCASPNTLLDVIAPP
jgi:hypothetical protein